MRLFNANRVSQSEEDRARDLRLTSIASRYRARPEISLVPDSEPEPQPEMILEPEPEVQPVQPEQPEPSEWPTNE